MQTFRPDETGMTRDEAELLIQRMLEKGAVVGSQISVQDVAELLAVPEDEVAAMLAQVRASAPVKPKRKVTRRERRVWLFGGVLSLLLIGGGLFAASNLRVGPFDAPRTQAAFPDTMVTVGDSSYYLASNREPLTHLSTEVIGAAQDLVSVPATSRVDQSLPESEKELLLIRQKKWAECKTVRLVPFSVSRMRKGAMLRWASAEVPVYLGRDSHAADLVEKERKRRISQAITDASDLDFAIKKS